MSEDEFMKILAALRHLRKSGQLSEPLYCKEVVKLAAMRADQKEFESSVDLLRGLPREYFEKSHYQQMKDDEDFADISFNLALTLVENGYAPEDPTKLINMKPGMA